MVSHDRLRVEGTVKTYMKIYLYVFWRLLPKEDLNKTMRVTENLNVFAYMCMDVYVLFKRVCVFVCVSLRVLMSGLLLLF